LDFTHNRLLRCYDRIVAESHDVKPHRTKRRFTRSIFLAGMVVDRAIDLDHQARFGAVEIHNEAVKRLLAAEPESPGLTAAQCRPQNGFGRRRLPAHALGFNLRHSATPAVRVRRLEAMLTIPSSRAGSTRHVP
jgi:hypothetical protein